jgi:hypothetical protein
MWEWSEHLKLGKSSAFVKRDLRLLSLTEAEFEADFFLDTHLSTKRREFWKGMVVEREVGALLAMEDVYHRPPTVNDLATLLAHAMLRPPDRDDRQRPGRLYLRDRPQWQELLPHLRELRIKVVFAENLPRFDAEAIAWMEETGTATDLGEALVQWLQKTKGATKLPSPDAIQAVLRRPFPPRKRTWHEAAMILTEWTDTMWKGAFPRRDDPVPAYDPTTTVSVAFTAEELRAILTETRVASTKKLCPRLEAAGEGGQFALAVEDWGTTCFALCGTRTKDTRVRKQLLGIAFKIANRLAEALGIAAPPAWIEKKGH